MKRVLALGDEEGELAAVYGGGPWRSARPPEYPLHVVGALEAQRALAPRVWVPGQWAAWFHESLLVYPCPECNAAALSPCVGPLEARPCMDEGGWCHAARGAMRAVSQPPFDGKRDHALRNGSELAARSHGLLPYPAGTAYLGRYPAVVGEATVRSREELSRLSGAAVAQIVEPVVAPVVADLAKEPAVRAGQTTLGAWFS